MSDHDIDVMVRKIADEMQSRKPNGPVNVLAEKLKLNIGSVLVVVGAISGAVWWGAGEFNEIKNTLKEATTDKWKGAHMVEWAHRLEQGNKKLDLVVPSPTAVKRDLEAQ